MRIDPRFRHILLLVCCLFPAIAAAQTTATLAGVVNDATGLPLHGVAITLTDAGTNVIRTARTNEGGRFVLAGLPAGDYSLRAEFAGFAPHIRQLRLTVAENVSVPITLSVTGADTVTVRGGAPAVNTRSGELSYLVDQRAIDWLPVNGRNFTDLVGLQPGVSIFPHRDNGSVVAHGLAMSVNGQDPRANVYLLDGTLLNDFTNGPAGSAAGTALGMDTVREFRVETNGYSAEFGRNVGGQINAITKSGTNSLTGSAFEYHRNEALDARNYFDVGPKPDFTRNQFGGTVGGPLRRDRLFLFVGYEGLRERLGRTIVTTVPDDNARLGVLPDGTVAIDPAIQPYLDEFPRANGENPRRRARQIHLPIRSDARSAFLSGPPRRGAPERRSVVRTIHGGRCRSGAADRLSAVSACIRIPQPVHDHRVPAGDGERHDPHRPDGLQPHDASGRPCRPTPRKCCRCSCRAGRCWVPSTSAGFHASVRRPQRTSACGKT